MTSRTPEAIERRKERARQRSRNLTPAQKEHRRITAKARRAAKRAALPPKPVKVKPPKLTAPTSHASPFKTVTQPRPANRESSAKKRWAEMEPIYPVNPDGSPAFVYTKAKAPPETIYWTNTHAR
jgi:hypothetical protein